MTDELRSLADQLEDDGTFAWAADVVERAVRRIEALEEANGALAAAAAEAAERCGKADAILRDLVAFMADGMRKAKEVIHG